MNHRERFVATMHYQPRDRAPLYDFNFWDETIPIWHKQGLPATVTQANSRHYFGLDASLGGGEPPIVGMGAALANAIFDATGKRLLELPMTPERVKAALA